MIFTCLILVFWCYYLHAQLDKQKKTQLFTLECLQKQNTILIEVLKDCNEKS